MVQWSEGSKGRATQTEETSLLGADCLRSGKEGERWEDTDKFKFVRFEYIFVCPRPSSPAGLGLVRPPCTHRATNTVWWLSSAVRVCYPSQSSTEKLKRPKYCTVVRPSNIEHLLDYRRWDIVNRPSFKSLLNSSPTLTRKISGGVRPLLVLS